MGDDLVEMAPGFPERVPRISIAECIESGFCAHDRSLAVHLIILIADLRRGAGQAASESENGDCHRNRLPERPAE